MREHDALLQALNGLLDAADVAAGLDPGPTRYPLIFIVGCPRSGTTLFLQLLARYTDIACPTNLLARFSAAPHVGAMVQRLLFDPQLDTGSGLTARPRAIALESRYGKTRGMLNVNEFYHFWRRHLDFRFPKHFSAEELARVDVPRLQTQLRRLEAVFDRPFACKGLALQYNLGFFRDCFPNSLFIWIRRDPDAVMQSILRAREALAGDRAAWWSVMPPGFEDLIRRPVPEQIAGQVFGTERSLESGLRGLPESAWMRIEFETLLREPAAALDLVLERLTLLGAPARRVRGRIRLAPPRQREACGERDARALREAWEILCREVNP